MNKIKARKHTMTAITDKALHFPFEFNPKPPKNKPIRVTSGAAKISIDVHDIANITPTIPNVKHMLPFLKPVASLGFVSALFISKNVLSSSPIFCY